MLKNIRIFLLFPILLNAGLFDWIEAFSSKAERAKNILESFDAGIAKALEDYDVPGLAVGVIVDGHVVYAKGLGYRDLENKVPVTTETLFAIGSCTKAFTTFVMGNLVDEGIIHWDQPVIDALPEFRLWDQYATTNLTIRDLLTHRSGMPPHEFVWYNSKMSKTEMLKRIRFLQPSSDIRKRYQYGNLMYFTAGLLMEEATGKTWEELVQEKILTPLGMNHTNFSVEKTKKSSNYAFPYLKKHDQMRNIPFRNLSLIASAGGLNSNVVDMLRWIEMHLKGGKWKDECLISPVTLQEIHAPQIIIPGAPETNESLLTAYAMGWGVVSYRGYYLVSHDGVSDGFTSVVGILPSENIGVVVLANKNMTSLPRYLSLELIDRILELPHIEWLKEGVQNIKKNKESVKQSQLQNNQSRKENTTPSHHLEDYVGLYHHPGYGMLTIDLVDGKLQAIYNDLVFTLGHWHYDVFNIVDEMQDTIISFEGKKFTFCNNAQGDIGELKVPFEPSADDIVFQRKPKEKLETHAHLCKYKGIYEIYCYIVEIVIRDNNLIAVIPGQPNYALVPTGTEHEFSVKEKVGSTVRFVLNRDNKVEEVLLIHPYGAFSAIPKQ